MHPYRWLRAGLVPPDPFLVCDPAVTVEVLAFWLSLMPLTHSSGEPGCLFSQGEKGNANLDSFRAVAEDLAPLLGEVQLPRLSGDILYGMVQKKTPTAGSLDGWGWREFKALLVTWFDMLASLFTLVEEEGVWPDGLLDTYIAMIPKADGDSTPLGQRPLCVLPIAYRLWASVRLLHLGEWLGLGCLTLFSALAGGVVPLRPGILRLLIVRNPCLVPWILMSISLWRMSSSPFIPLIGVFWTTSLAVWGCLDGFVMPIF